MFPAIPEYVAEQGARFTNLRVEGAALVSSSIKDSKVEFITVTALKGGRFDIKLQGRMKCSSVKGVISIDEKHCEYLFEPGEEITFYAETNRI